MSNDLIIERIGSMVGDTEVHITNYRGPTPEEIADRAVDKIIHVGKDAHPLLIEQARAYKRHIHALLVHYLREAQTAERLTICGHLIKGGHADLAEIIRSV